MLYCILYVFKAFKVSRTKLLVYKVTAKGHEFHFFLSTRKLPIEAVIISLHANLASFASVRAERRVVGSWLAEETKINDGFRPEATEGDYSFLSPLLSLPFRNESDFVLVVYERD